MESNMSQEEKTEIRSAMDTALEKAEQAQVDFVLVRGELTTSQIIRAEKDTIRDVDVSTRAGVGVEVVLDKAKGYSFSSKFDTQTIEATVEKAIEGAKGSAKHAEKEFSPKEISHEKYEGTTPNVTKHPKNKDIAAKKDLLMSGTKEILEDEVVSLTSVYGEVWGTRWFFTSDGLEREWHPLKTGILYRPVVKKNGKMGNASEQAVASLGLSLFNREGKRPKETAKKALKGASDMAEAQSIKPGRYSLVTDPEFGGVIAHESFGHLTEADFVITGESILTEREGERLGSEHATVIESGDPQQYGYYLPYDDEGTATKTVHLLKDGIFSGFLHSRYTANTLETEPTGNARALNFRYPSIVRMRNTYFGAGDHTQEELFELIGEGIYVIGSQGGQTESTGTFTFSADRAYRIEDGEIQHPLKGVVVRGNILDFLKNVKGASKHVELHTSLLGGCGKGGQGGLPTGVGGPYLAVKEAIVSGGR